jgi:hypothetical protein
MTSAACSEPKVVILPDNHWTILHERSWSRLNVELLTPFSDGRVTASEFHSDGRERKSFVKIQLLKDVLVLPRFPLMTSKKIEALSATSSVEGREDRDFLRTSNTFARDILHDVVQRFVTLATLKMSVS